MQILSNLQDKPDLGADPHRPRLQKPGFLVPTRAAKSDLDLGA